VVVAAPWAPLPPRVGEMCGQPPVAEESLCNVDEDLQDAFLLVERIVAEGGDALSEHLGNMIRSRLVSVEWYPDPTAIDAGLLGMYEERSHRVYLSQRLRPEPLRVRAAVLAHEVDHAALLFDGVGEHLRPAEACLENEAKAFKVEIVVYERARHLVAEPSGPEGSVDRHLADELDMWWRLSGGETFTPAGLDDLANRHIFLHGYAIDCNWR
jgi:hypothetical protein